jgi:pimeloyl-ACP methyl ester carboxylesterase
MANFVLVHGAWGGCATWGPVAARLRAAGHRVHTPSLTGIGERKHLFSGSVNLSTHIADVCGVIESEGLGDVVLLGHSYGGMVITGVADRLPGRLATLVYLDAFVPDDGQSMLDLQTPEGAARIIAGAGEHGGFGIPSPHPSRFRLPAEKEGEVDFVGALQPLATFVERVRLACGPWTGRRVYIVAGNYTDSIFLRNFWPRVTADPAWETTSIPCGHLVQVEQPDQLAEALLRLV